MTPAIARLSTLLLAMALNVHAQDVGEARAATPQEQAFRCPKPESPRARAFECNSVIPDFERTLVSEWRRGRRDLAALGITPTLSYAGGYFVNTSNPPREGSYGGGLFASVDVDFEKLARVRGLSAYIDAWWMQASNADAIVNTNVFYANSNFVGNGFWVGQLYVQQTFRDDHLTVAAGRLAPGVAFGTLPVFSSYTNAAINPNPRSLTINDPSFAQPPPGTQWGVQALYGFNDTLQGGVGVFNNNPNSADGKNHGLDWRWREGNRGVLAIAQFNWHRNQRSQDSGMPGHYGIGAFWDGNDFATLGGSPVTTKNNWGVYAMAQQQITQPGGSGSLQGVTIWGAVTYSAKEDINPLPFFAAAGASYEGPLPHRPNDVASIGWYYGRASDTLQSPRTHTQALEVFYKYSINAALHIVLDAQYFFRVNGESSPGTAVFGAQFEVAF